MNENKNEKAIIVGVSIKNSKINNGDEIAMNELKGLVEAVNGDVIAEIVQNRDRIDAAYYIGHGKALEIKNYADELDVDLVVFNNDLTGSQLRNLEEIIGTKVVDRTTLILDIFASRAISSEGKLQVKLAQLKYRLPRLQGFGKALSRTGGGIGTRGPGEQQLETDRRHIRSEISRLEDALKRISENREIKRKSRLSSELPIVSLVGYTNSGKSTIMNALIDISTKDTSSKSEKYVMTKDMLFATLDTSLRHIKLENGAEFLLTDTVGFVSNLPTFLIEAFKSTLEEINYSDLILVVIDLSETDITHQIETTDEILSRLKTESIPRLTVYNKVDKLGERDVLYYLSDNSIRISALNEQDVLKLADKIKEHISGNNYKVTLSIPFNDMKILDYFSKHYNVGDVEYDEKGAVFSLELNEADYGRYSDYIVGEENEPGI